MFCAGLLLSIADLLTYQTAYRTLDRKPRTKTATHFHRLRRQSKLKTTACSRGPARPARNKGGHPLAALPRIGSRIRKRRRQKSASSTIRRPPQLFNRELRGIFLLVSPLAHPGLTRCLSVSSCGNEFGMSPHRLGVALNG